MPSCADETDDMGVKTRAAPLPAVFCAVAALLIAGCAESAPSEPELDAAPAGFELHAAFRLELAAAEPVTVDPIDLAFDEKGRAFVLEFPGYPDMERPARIVELLDRDGDGRWDERRPFADGLGMADSILPWRRGLLVAAPPDVVYLEDTDGDGRAERRDVLLRGFAEGNPQHNVNALRYGLDNWVHGVNGGNGARVFWPDAPEEVTDIGQDDFRVDFSQVYPGRRRFERTGRGAGGFGMTFGPWGRLFGTHNLDHLSQVVIPRRYLVGLPAAWQDGRRRLAAPADGGPAELFPIGVRQTRPNHPEQSSRFSAACAVLAYAGGAFDGVWPDGSGLNVFVADPSANVVHRAVVDTAGAVAKASRGRPGVEFLASTDPAFRPVNLTVGPDGALYVVDMHRGVIEHPEWIPDRMEAELDLYEGAERGRIYRIVPSAAAPPPGATAEVSEPERPDLDRPEARAAACGEAAGGAESPDPPDAAERTQVDEGRRRGPSGARPLDLAGAAAGAGALDRSRPGDLVEALSHPNQWRRLTAQRLLVEEYAAMPSKVVVEPLRELLADPQRPLGRLHALWTLSALGQLDPESLGNALGDPEPELRRNAVLAFEEQIRGAAPAGPIVVLAADVAALISDPDPGVRLQAMLTTGLLLRSEVDVGPDLRARAMSAVVAMAGPGAVVATGAASASPPSAADGRWLRLAGLSVLAADPVDSLERLLGSAGDAAPPASKPSSSNGAGESIERAELVERVAALLSAERLAEAMSADFVLRALADSAPGASGMRRALLDGLTAAIARGGNRAAENPSLAGVLQRAPWATGPVRSSAGDDSARPGPPQPLQPLQSLEPLQGLQRLRQSGDAAVAAAAWRLSAAVGAEVSAAELSLLDCAGIRAADPAGLLQDRLEALVLLGLRRNWPAASPGAPLRCPRAGGAGDVVEADTLAMTGTWLERMGALLGAEQPGEVQRAAMAELSSAGRSLAVSGSSGRSASGRSPAASTSPGSAAVAAYLIERWPRLGPEARRDAGSYLIRGRARHPALLDAIESGRIRLGEMNFDLERRRFLLRSPEPEIRRRARALFDDAGVVTRAAAIEAMRPALDFPGDADRGERLFLELCARCHRRGGLGGGPGPDLSGAGRKSAETLLHDILDPNAAVDAGYVNYVVETANGEVHSGLLAESFGSGVVLRAAGDLLIELPGESVREVRSDGLSMMPEELEAGLEPGDMADLLAFLGALG